MITDSIDFLCLPLVIQDYLCVTRKLISRVNRPSVSGAVLQTPLLIINQVSQPFGHNLQDPVCPKR